MTRRPVLTIDVQTGYCQCLLCANTWYHHDARQFAAAKCPRCQGKLVPPQAAIAQRANRLFEQRRAGRAEQDWADAERQLIAEAVQLLPETRLESPFRRRLK